jgi:ribose transport system permease protein
VMNDYDLSIGATSSFATMFVSVLVASDAKPLLLGILFAMGVGVLIGMTNGLFVAYVGLSALVVTIAIGSVLNGAEFLVSGNNQIYGGYPQGFVEFTRSETIHIPNLVFVALCIAIVFWLMLERTALGRNMRAVGGNSEAARLAGVNVRRTRAIGFVLCASAATLAGTLYAGKQAVAYPLAGLNVLLPSYAAAFLGAAMFKLGQFNIWGTVVGVMIAEIVANGLLLLSVPSYGTYIFQGAILVAALTFARIVGRRQAA